MRKRQYLIDADHETLAEEQRLYELVKDKGPGLKGYHPVHWRQWLEAVSKTTAASKALREAFADSLPQEDH